MEKNMKLDPMLNWTLYPQMPEDQINHFIFEIKKFGGNVQNIQL